MKRFALVAGWLACLGGAMVSGSASAVEPAREFLDGLREREYFDVALDYLNAAKDNPNVPIDFKETIDFERGVTLVRGARSVRDPGLRETNLDEGQKILSAFVAARPNHILAIAARSEMGNVMVERARLRMERAKKAASAEKTKLNTEGRALYTEAVKVFDTLTKELAERLKAYPAAIDPKRDEKRFSEREQFRKDYLQSQLLQAATKEEMAETHAKGSKEQTALLTAAAEEYSDIYEKYRTRLAGMYARLYQARCLQKLGKHPDAIAYFNELLANPDAPDAFRVLKVKTMELAVQSWIALKQYPEVFAKTAPLVDSARPNEDKSDEFMSMRIQVARAAKLYSDELKTKNAKDPQIRKLLTDGRRYVTYVSKFPGTYQEDARKMIVDFTAGDADTVAQRPEPKSFEEARNAGKDSIDAMQSAQLILRSVPPRLKLIKDPAEKAELEKQIAAAQETAEQSRQDALTYLRLALRLADRDVQNSDLNFVRYLLCYLLYAESNYYDSAVIGEFIARTDPGHAGARQCAKIAMASYLQLYTQSKSDDKEFESQQIIGIADYIVKKWPDQPEASEALNTLIPFMIKEGRLDQAEAYLAQIPADSPHRGAAELKLGQALWAEYLEKMSQLQKWKNKQEEPPADLDMAAHEKDLEGIKAKAKTTLADGVKRMQEVGETSTVLATAVLSLAQIYTDTNEAAKAVALIEDPKIGVLTLVRAKDPSVEREGIPEEIYKTSLRAYISSLAGAKNADEVVKKARTIMDELKTRVGAAPAGQEKLVGIYVALARDLQQQMELADANSKKSLGKGFEAFLEQVAAEATELNVLNWVAETYRGMGESFGPSSQGLTPEAKLYYQKAADTYNKILDMGKTKKLALQPAMLIQLKLQLARTQRGLLKFTDAMNIFEDILSTNNALLPVQVEAAYTYQEWGSLVPADKADTYYKSAMLGARQDKAKRKNIIWGWGQLANVTTSYPQYRDTFHEARYNLALCRYTMGMKYKDQAQRTETLNRAKRDIAFTAGLYPEMGGEKWIRQYDALLKNIQKALGEKADGLAGLDVDIKRPGTTPTGAKSPATKAAPATKTSTSTARPTATAAAK